MHPSWSTPPTPGPLSPPPQAWAGAMGGWRPGPGGLAEFQAQAGAPGRTARGGRAQQASGTCAPAPSTTVKPPSSTHCALGRAGGLDHQLNERGVNGQWFLGSGSPSSDAVTRQRFLQLQAGERAISSTASESTSADLRLHWPRARCPMCPQRGQGQASRPHTSVRLSVARAQC